MEAAAWLVETAGTAAGGVRLSAGAGAGDSVSSAVVSVFASVFAVGTLGVSSVICVFAPSLKNPLEGGLCRYGRTGGFVGIHCDLNAPEALIGQSCRGGR